MAGSPAATRFWQWIRSCATTKFCLSSDIKAKVLKLAEDLEEIKALLVLAYIGIVNDQT
jgi:hypothetical protein